MRTEGVLVFDILSHQGAGPLRFGMTMDAVRAAIGEQPVSFQKTPSAVLPTDAFRAASVHVYYKQPGLCCAIEFGPDADVQLDGHQMSGVRYQVAREILLERDPGAIEEDDGLTSHAVGVALYCPDLEEDDAIVGGVLVFERGYYERVS